MTNWTREFIGGHVVYIIQPDAGDALGASNTVYQLLPQLLPTEEIRIKPLSPADPLQPNLGFDTLEGS